MARDGTGGLVYLKQVAGVPHVFVSVLAGGVFQAPVEIDSTLPGASSQPVIAAGNGGLLLVGFINAGNLYEVGRTSAAHALGAPALLAGGAINPSISMSNFGKAYLAFTAAYGTGDDVRTAYYYAGQWALEAPALNATPGDDAGTGAGRPEVATAGDGVAIVVWGENGHVFSRRVWATAPSVVDEQADAPLPGCTEASADDPVVATEGDSSYADVAFDEVVSCGGPQQSRVLMNRLQASIYDGISQVDGLAGTSQSADDPQITMGEYGNGWVTSAGEDTNNLIATAMGADGVTVGITQVNSLPEASAPDGLPATAGLFSNFVAWQQDPGSAGMPEIRARYAPANGTLGPEMILSSASQGPVDAAGGLAADGDVNGDAAVAWLQGSGPTTEVVVAQMYQPPAGFAAKKPAPYARTLQPVLAWSAAGDAWGPVRYLVSVDGTQVAQTEATSVRVPAPLANGPHTWQVTAVNPAGRQSQMRAVRVFVDTVPPLAAFTLYGHHVEGSRLHVFATYADLPPVNQPAADASGVATVTIAWGDGTMVKLLLGAHRSYHAYTRPGRYRITMVVTDKAGNVARAFLEVRIAKPAKKAAGKTPPAKKATLRSRPADVAVQPARPHASTPAPDERRR